MSASVGHGIQTGIREAVREKWVVDTRDHVCDLVGRMWLPCLYAVVINVLWDCRCALPRPSETTLMRFEVHLERETLRARLLVVGSLLDKYCSSSTHN
jgi:hypothetical protein